ncbi:unnamed protein product [Caretta caretta]
MILGRDWQGFPALMQQRAVPEPVEEKSIQGPGALLSRYGHTEVDWMDLFDCLENAEETREETLRCLPCLEEHLQEANQELAEENASHQKITRHAAKLEQDLDWTTVELEHDKQWCQGFKQQLAMFQVAGNSTKTRAGIIYCGDTNQPPLPEAEGILMAGEHQQMGEVQEALKPGIG